MTMRILLVDDSEAFLLTGSLALGREGYRCKTAANGQRALDLVSDAVKAGTPYDMLVLDIRMPVMNGLELLDELQRLQIRVPVLMITGVIEKNTEQALRQRGCHDVLRKPFPIAEFVERVKAILEPRRGGPGEGAAGPR